jgi:transposase-like protein
MAEDNLIPLPFRGKDEVGNVYEKLTVVEFAGKTKSGDSRWLCKCECGKTTTVARGELRKGSTKSCGCHRARSSGNYKTSEYTSWKEMKRRCDPNYKDKHLYADRGITLCEQWRTSFNTFLADMGPKPFPEATVDRKNNDLGYTPDNCRWATKLEQSQNTRKARMLTFSGETLCLREWARRLGVRHRTIARRLDEQGWNMEQIVEHYTL